MTEQPAADDFADAGVFQLGPSRVLGLFARTHRLPEQLTDLDRDCLEYQTGFLSGLVLASWGEPEQMSTYARRYASVLALLGRVREYEYYTLVADAAARGIGLAAQKAWELRPLRARILASPDERARWIVAYTDSLITEANDRLRVLQDETADYRAAVAPHFGASEVPLASAPHTTKNRI